MKKTIALVLALLLLLACTACKKEEELGTSEARRSLVRVFDEIYKDVDLDDTVWVEDSMLEEIFHLDPETVQAYYIRYGIGKIGVADVAIVRPVKGQEDAVVAALTRRKLDRMDEFQNYDVHNAYKLCSEAQIYQRDNYVILIMMEDADDVRAIIDSYLS